MQLTADIRRRTLIRSRVFGPTMVVAGVAGACGEDSEGPGRDRVERDAAGADTDARGAGGTGGAPADDAGVDVSMPPMPDGSPAMPDAMRPDAMRPDAMRPDAMRPDARVDSGAGELVTGQDIFRHDTFGDERQWTDQLRMHEVIQSSVDPMTALSVGLKVDADALPAGILDDADLEDPATTVALLDLDAVVGLRGQVDDAGNLTQVGITCALCHSDVDDSVMEGIGSRLDGHANRDLDPGLILSLSPAFADEASQEVLTSWGPGYFDPRFNQDGINEPVLIPPIYGLEGVPLETYTGDGPISYWNRYVAVTQMGGQGSFFDPRIDVRVTRQPDRVAPKLPALFDYQVSLPAPEPEAGSYDTAAAERGRILFEGKAECSTCHSGPNFTDAAETLHAPEETGMDPTTAERSATGLYRTTPLRALARHPPYFHDGSAATLGDVVEHYDTELSLGLTGAEQQDLVEYLKSL